MANSIFYDLDPIEEIAVNLFHGWGYNFYRLENQLRADDLVVRNQVCGLLGRARGAIDAAESAYRRAFLPPPSRERPRPDPAAMANAQLLEQLAQAVGALEGQIRAQPVPENDRMTQRYREEAATLQTLIQSDERLAGQCELLRSMVQGQDSAAILAMMGDIEAGLEAIRGTLQRRDAVLMGRG